MSLLAGLHDREGAHLVPAGGWCVDTVALSQNPQPPDYAALAPGVRWIARLNWGYGSTGTLPPGGGFAAFARRCAEYVAGSQGCSRWVIGNEPNLPREWPNGQPISPQLYAEFYLSARDAIHAVPGHERDEVLVAAPGPWNNQYKYPGNEKGDWLVYWRDVLRIVGDACDGFSIHAYTHGDDPALVQSNAKMDPPFQARSYHFRTYREYLAEVPAALVDRPAYLTEANGNGPWRAVGLMPAMLDEIGGWNNLNHRPLVHAVVFYRYPHYDPDIDYGMASKPDVLDEFRRAAPQYAGPQLVQAQAQSFTQYIPKIEVPKTVVPTLPKRIWDMRLTDRGVRIETPAVQGSPLWTVKLGRWLDAGEARLAGPDHHILVDVLDEQGNRMVGVPLLVTWPSGEHPIVTEAKAGEPFSVNYPMSSSLNEFSIRVNDGLPSEVVTGIGMGANGNPSLHTSTVLHFQRVTVPKSSQFPEPGHEVIVPAVPPTEPVPAPGGSMQAQVPALAHPVVEPRYRWVSQPFGVRPEYYRQFSVDDVPLRGHEGIDFGTPIGALVAAVDVGQVVEVGDTGDRGYGKYIKLAHRWGESVYAHLSEPQVQVGERVGRGEMIGLSGSTGNSSGPHLHFGLRVHPFDRRDGWGGFTDPAPYLINVGTSAPKPAGPKVPELIVAAAHEFKVAPEFLGSLIWGESSFQPGAKSAAGAMGLGQLMPATWAEWAPRVGASDPWDAWDNLRTSAAYLAWILPQVGGDWRRAVIAYNWGIGYVLEGKLQPPAETVEFAAKVVHGADFVAAWSA